ncbi:osmosensitive K+ channel histidine kinase sensor subunit [Calothrix sp. NIES-4071]|nr:osmosensitive K+ channel histidine kinase sensor subunit [Calothrix sp. NIES-4071]BAZ59828.1 osmosensitive K+ channel histidine kinase sensor subunit [Calothrix sp. NIES-4105]
MYYSPTRNTAPENIYTPSARHGKHKIFIGMAPGVGKTYKMLEEACQLKRTGIDVVIGYLETHGRQQTQAKAKGFEIIPPKEIVINGQTKSEMDVDAIIARHPKLVLIDELAHINILGAQHHKRYQDIEAILAAGIDVFSTVNIQHLEQLRYQVAELTGIAVQEYIPDSLLEAAQEIILVDITPETLEERLSEGKIYPLGKIEPDIRNFYQRCNLVALRELALRQVANKIEQQSIQEVSQDIDPTDNHEGRKKIRQFCSIQERILVCISTSPNSLRLIRRGARLADYMNAPLHVLYVNHPDHSLTKEEAAYIERCRLISQELQGDFLEVCGENIAIEITNIVNSYRITQIMFGQTHRSFWQKIFQGSIIDKLMRLLNHIDIHIISAEQ